MNLRVITFALAFITGLWACKNEEQRSRRMAGARSVDVGASNDLLGKSLEDESINSLYESSNIRALQEEMKDSEEKGDDEEAKGDDPVVDDDPEKGIEPCEEGKDGCEPEEEQPVCVWNDPKNYSYRAPISGMPDSFEVSLTEDFISKGLGRFEGEFGDRDYIVSFSLFHNNKDLNQSSVIQYADKKGLWATFYTLIVKDYDKASCQGLASGQLDQRRDRGGCFALGTEITMADGTKKPIAVLNAGDMVRNPVTGKAMEVEAVVSGPEPDKHMYRIGYGGKSVVVTQTHPFQTKVGIQAAKHLRLGDKVLTASGDFYSFGKGRKVADKSHASREKFKY